MLQCRRLKVRACHFPTAWKIGNIRCWSWMGSGDPGCIMPFLPQPVVTAWFLWVLHNFFKGFTGPPKVHQQPVDMLWLQLHDKRYIQCRHLSWSLPGAHSASILFSIFSFSPLIIWAGLMTIPNLLETPMGSGQSNFLMQSKACLSLVCSFHQQPSFLHAVPPAMTFLSQVLGQSWRSPEGGTGRNPPAGHRDLADFQLENPLWRRPATTVFCLLGEPTWGAMATQSMGMFRALIPPDWLQACTNDYESALPVASCTRGEWRMTPVVFPK